MLDELDELDGLIEEAAIYGELSSGTPAHWLQSHADKRMMAVLAAGTARPGGKAADWTPEEKQFVRDNFRHMSDKELAQALGRTTVGVRLYRKRHLSDLPPRQHDAALPTAREVARLLGMGCAKSVVRLIEEGLLPGQPLPVDRLMWGVPRSALIRFAVNPENWIYFKPERVRDPYIKRLIQLRQARWQDEWWRPGQVAAYHGCTQQGVNACIHEGRLPAKRWGNWWIKRSDAVALKIVPGKGFSEETRWTGAGDAFLLLARALGYSLAAIAGMCGWKESRVEFRLKTLHARKAVSRLIAAHNLQVQYDPARGSLLADWRNYRRRFRRLAAANQRFLGGTATAKDLSLVTYTLQTWAQWHATNEEQRYLAYCLQHGSGRTAASLREQYERLCEWGIDPLTPSMDA